MNSRDKEILQKYYSSLLDVIYSTISPCLISSFTITLELHDEIESKPTERKKMEKLLSILPTRGDRALRELIYALKPSYDWIAKKLEGEYRTGRGESRSRINNRNSRPLPEISIANHIREITRILQRNARVSTHWGFIANSMSLMPTTIMDIKREMAFSGGLEYAIYTMLDAWVTQVGSSKSSFSKLIAILNEERMNLCGETVREYWATVTIGVNNATDDENDVSSQSQSPRRRSRSPIVTDV